MRWSIQAVGGGSQPFALSDAALASPVLALRFDSSTYLFNAPEGTQRALVSRGVRVGKLRNVFVTGSMGWRKWGGLPGFLLTVADSMASSVDLDKAAEAGTPSLAVHGGDGLVHCLGSMRWFVYRGSVKVDVEEYPRHHHSLKGEKATFDFEDENLRVCVVSVPPAGSLRSETSNAESTAEQELQLLESLKSEASDDEAAEGCPALPNGMDRSAAGFMLSHSPSSPPPSNSNATGTKRKASTPLSATTSPSTSHAIKRQILDSMFSNTDPDAHPLSFNNPLNQNSTASESSSKKQQHARKSIARLPEHHPTGRALSYLILTPDIRGKFDPVKAKQLGVPKGPMFGLLQKGQSVTLPNGTTVVEPCQVLGPGRHGAVVLVIDLPDLGYLDNFSAELSQRIAQLDAALGSRAGWIDSTTSLVLIHMSEREVVENQQYWNVIDSMSLAMLGETWTARTKNIVFHSPTSADSTSTPASSVAERWTPTYAKFTALSYRLSKIDGSVFPDPVDIAGTFPPTVSNGIGREVVPAVPLLELVVEPAPSKLDTSNVPPVFAEQLKGLEAEQRDVWGQLLDSLVPELGGGEGEKRGNGVEVWPLGTGSAAPSKYRNVSSTLIVLPKVSGSDTSGSMGMGSKQGDADDRPTVLLDCGESTANQIFRLIPYPRSRVFVKNLRVIFLSHLHADHQLGVIGVLRDRARIFRQDGAEPTKVVVIAPWKYRLFLDEYADLEHGIREQFVFVESEAIVHPECFGNDRKGAGWGGWKGPGLEGRSGYDFGNLARLVAELGIPVQQFATIPVLHCPSAFAGTFVTSSGFQVSFSGDCRPSQLFAQVAKGSDVLVHEATFEDELGGEAVAKRHCTVSEAVEIGVRCVCARGRAARMVLTLVSSAEPNAATVSNPSVSLNCSRRSSLARSARSLNSMKAKFLLLTHFSQRYPKVPPLPPSNDSSMLVAQAFDGMRIRMGSSDPERLDRLFKSAKGRRVLELMLQGEQS